MANIAAQAASPEKPAARTSQGHSKKALGGEEDGIETVLGEGLTNGRERSRQRPRQAQDRGCATLPAPVGRSRSALGRRPRASSRPGASATGSQSPNARAQATAAPPGRPARG